jgi:hypothetical protein
MPGHGTSNGHSHQCRVAIGHRDGIIFAVPGVYRPHNDDLTGIDRKGSPNKPGDDLAGSFIRRNLPFQSILLLPL